MANFDRLAKVYAGLERLAFKQRLQRARERCLPYAKNCKRGLLLGDGDGRFSSKLLETNKAIQIDSIDSSLQMLHTAQQRAGTNAKRLKALHADALANSYLPSEYDFVGLHFFLDCFRQNDIDELVPKIESSMRANAILAFSDFQTPRNWHKFVVTCLYQVFRVSTRLNARKLPLVKWSDKLALLDRQEFLGGLVFTEIRQKELHS